MNFTEYLIEGEGSRNVGDYDIVSELAKEEALEQIDHAEMFLELGNKLLLGSQSENLH